MSSPWIAQKRGTFLARILEIRKVAGPQGVGQDTHPWHAGTHAQNVEAVREEVGSEERASRRLIRASPRQVQTLVAQRETRGLLRTRSSLRRAVARHLR